MKTKKIALLTALSFISLTINANNVYLKNIYTTSTGTEKPVTIQTNTGKYDVGFNKTIPLGELQNITVLSIKTSTTLPVDITKYIKQLKAEAPQKEGENALLIVYPSNPLTLGTWNIQRQWLPQRPTNPPAPTKSPQISPAKPTQSMNNPLEQFCKMTYEQKRNAIDNGFLDNDLSTGESYQRMLDMIETLSPNKNTTIQTNWNNLKKLLALQTDNILYIAQLKKAITATYHQLENAYE